MTPTPDDSTIFHVPAAGYDRFMGRYLGELGPAFADAAGVDAGQRALDVGCGPGGLTGELVRRLGVDAVAAVDPSPPFVQACRERNPGVDVRVSGAEELPFDDEQFDVVLASLVVGFMRDRYAGAREMLRVTRPGGTVGACFWVAGGMEHLDRFWAAVAELHPDHPGEGPLFGRREGEIAGLLEEVGLVDVTPSVLRVSARYADFEDWWEPITFGIGPAGAYCAALPEDEREALREAARKGFADPENPFTLHASAWCAVGHRPT